MSLALHDLLVCCKGLDNDKATERKKEAERFRRLLKDPETVQELDRTSGPKAAKGSKQLSWDSVFRFLQRYVQKETEHLQSSKATVSDTTIATRLKKMAEMCSLVKYFIRCANKRGPRLQFKELLRHVMEVLQSSYSCSAYGEEYSSLLVKDVLSVRKYWCDVTTQQWQNLLELFCGLFNSSSTAINRVLVSRVISTVVQGCCIQTDGLHSTLFRFFSKALLNVRQEKHLPVVEHLVSALNIFLRSAAMNCRMRVCGLGEELLPSVLYVWADMRPSSALKDEMVDFFNLQLCVHHPNGAKTPETASKSMWRSLLYNLYNELVSEISHIGSRGKYISGTRHIAVKDNLIELTADICHQLPARSRAGATEGTPSKRRRIELGWEVLREHLQPQHSDFDIIPWLQITTVLLSKYRSTVPGGELVPLLSVLCQLLGEQRRGERGAYVLGCLRELAPCPAAHPDRAPESRAELDRLWGRVWTLALRAVGSPQSEALSLGLLTSIIRAGLMSMDRESWKLFSGMAFLSMVILAPGLSQSPTTAPECLVRCLTLLTGVLAGYVSTGALSQEEAFKSPLFIKAKVPYGGPQLEENGMVRGLIPTGAQPLLAEEHLASEDLALLASLEFLCVCASVQPAHSLLFKPQEVRRKLLQLLEHVDFSRALHVNMVVAADTHAYGISPCTTVSPCFCVLRDLCSLYRQDQEVCATVLLGLLPAIQCLGQTHHPASEMRHVQGMLLQVISGFCILAQTGKCTAGVRAGLVKCLVALLEADPCCEWAVLDLKEEELPVSVLLPSHLADAHHHVRMLAAMSVERLFVEMKAGQPERRMLPLHHQQEAFERVYLKAQEGMRFSQSAPSEELRDEAFNRKASLLKCVSVVLCCSPVCEKQALFALFQSHKENNIEDQLIKKVLCSVSRALGYRSVKGFVSSHLYYLVAEWLGLRQADDRYNLESFPFALLGHDTLHDFYSASFQVLIPHLVYLEDFELVRSIGGLLGKDWRELLADCFPRIMVNILPYFVLSGQDPQVALQRGRATKVYDLLKDSSCLGKQRIDSLIQSNLAHIVVELLLTLYEGAGTGEQEGADLQRFIGELDPAPNPPYFSSHVIKATLDYISRCHGANHKSLVAILSKNPISIQRILLALCEKAVATTNGYERHRILLMYHLLVGLLLGEMEEGLGGAWAFVLRDIIYTLIHHFNSRWGSHHCDEVSTRSLLLCCDLLAAVCRAALQFCPDALECHLQVILGTLTAQVTSRPAISQQVLSLLRFLVVENQEKLRSAICRLEPFPDGPGEFKELRSVQHELKYSSGTFTLRQEIEHFLSVTSCDTLPLTRLEGLKELSRQLRQNKAAIRELLKECHGEEQSVLVKLILSLLHLCKVAANHPGGAHILEAAGSCLGELGPIDLSTIALLHGRDPLYTRAVTLFPSSHAQGLYILLDCMNHALTHHSIEVKKAAGQCVKSILGTQSGADFWEQHKDKQDPMLAYLNPFRTAKKKVPPRQVGPEESKELLESQGLWVPQTGAHKRWLKTLCAALLDSGGVRNHVLLLSRPLCLVRADFCQRALPLVVHSILQGDRDGSWRLLLSRHVQDFFTSCCRSSQASGRSATPLPVESDSDMVIQGSLDKASLRTMLSVVDYLRHQSSSAVGDTNSWLELNFLEVARAAQACSAHFTALLYSEIYVDKIKASTEESRRINFEENSQTFTISNLTQKSMEDNGISLQELLMEVYRCIGEPDSLYGCGGEKMSSPLTRIRTYEHEAMWGKALSSYDLHSSLPEVTRQVGIQALQNFGLSGILATYLRGLDSEGVEWGSELRELRFQAAWRRTYPASPGFNESVFGALLALNDKEFSMFDRTLKYARGAEVEELCRGSLEAVSSLYPAVRNLQSLGELQSVRQLFSRPLSDTTLAEVCRQWGQHSQLLADSDFPLVEPILALRSATMQTLLARAGDPDSTLFLSSVLTNHLMELCQLARNAGNTQLAERAVYQMKQLASGAARTAAASSSWQLEEAQVFWAKGEQGPALGLLKEMINTLEGQVDMNPALVPVYTESMRLCGNWLAESCLESPGVILEKYLERVKSLPVCCRERSQRTKAFLSLARFSDFQYQTIEKYMRSSAFENKQVLLEKAKAEVDLMKEHNVDSNRYTVKLEKELKMDELALSNLQGDRRRFLCKAVDNYVHCLAEGEQHDDWVFRLASLWLENADLREVNAMMKVGVKRIPSHKFLPLMYQLAARMGTKMSTDSAEDVGFHDVLNDLILRACLQHPHHTLFIILALVNANKDASFTSKSRLSKNTPQQPSPLDLERSEVARKIISVVRKKRGAMLKGMEYLCDAYITLAYMDASRHKQEKKPLPIPADQPIMKIQDLEEVTIPTVEIRVDPSGCYDNVVTIRSFKPQYRLVGGVNLPKIIDCVGSDGRSHRQLVKGQDDLRQDAVMQQVFSMCSTLLQRNAETRRRKLHIRRYKVVPFSQRSGVLEWCSGTVPIGEFLVDPQKGAHGRFRPRDWTNLACRKKMMDAQKRGLEGQLTAYSEVCRHFRPVFRHFCMERFLDPAVWMEKRLAYTRSVATSSIVGYIVGLGDRHIQNILIDEQTAELIHIDLGVAFEQGKILPTPETVPFRLTRDMVDGMGITGVEGVFRRCCEKTMEVMRTSQEAVLTIVEVLLYDPLFDWTMNPLKAFQLQHVEQQELNATLQPTLGADDMDHHAKGSSDSQSFNKVAERVLLRLQDKLKGVEEGAVLSVGGQVNLLIQQAMDPSNLSRLFSGWQAWV
uniref:non-specific serine/threonine protein kinase n=1 Tax=Gadus morhua TaxID=8049 RepID=A0A8C5ALW6_GADMO